mgnify:CR=1 FL=1
MREAIQDNTVDNLRYGQQTNVITYEDTTVSLRNITPIMADSILTRSNINNRRVNDRRVAEYSESMLNGDWVFNGDSIRFAANGNLLDGQHRLLACIKSNTAHTFLVVSNMAEKIGLTIDSGKNRNGGDALVFQAGLAPRISSAINVALKLYNAYNRGYLLSGSSQRLTNVEVVRHYNENKDLVDFCSTWIQDNMKRQGCLLPMGELLALMMVFYPIDADDCFTFFNMVFAGIGINENCTQLVLRDFLIDCKSGARRSNSTQKLHTIVKAWNSVRRGRNIKTRGRILFYPGKDAIKVAV